MNFMSFAKVQKFSQLSYLLALLVFLVVFLVFFEVFFAVDAPAVFLGFEETADWFDAGLPANVSVSNFSQASLTFLRGQKKPFTSITTT